MISQGQQINEYSTRTWLLINKYPNVCPSPIINMQFAHHSRHMALGCLDGTMYSVYYANMNEYYRIKTNFNIIHDIYFTKNDNYIVTVGDSDEIVFISNADQCIQTVMKAANPKIYDVDLS